MEETETITVTYRTTYYVDASMSTVNRFGPVNSRVVAEQLLMVLSARADVKKAELIIIREEV